MRAAGAGLPPYYQGNIHDEAYVRLLCETGLALYPEVDPLLYLGQVAAPYAGEIARIRNAVGNGAARVPRDMGSPAIKQDFQSAIFSEDNRIEVGHGRYGYVRNNQTTFHPALDISTLGDPTIHSPVTGTVVKVVLTAPEKIQDGTYDEYGAYIIIQDDLGYYHIFAHCTNNSFQGLQEDDPVEAGQAIAVMGMTGNANTEEYRTYQGPHVHYEVRLGEIFDEYGNLTPGGTREDPTRWAGIPNQQGSWYF